MLDIVRPVVVGAALALGMSATFMASAPAGAAETAGLRAGVSAAPAQGGAVPGIAPRHADSTAVYLDRAGRVIPTARTSDRTSEAAQLGCTPVSGRDNPHRSGTGVAVSGHGWWGKGTCSNSRADVLNCLYQWYTDNSWRQMACSPVKELSPGTGGSTSRTVARRDCSNTLRTSWRNHVNVDVKGEIDSNEVPYNQADVDCRVY